MSGFLLLSPTGSGKSWACEHDRFFMENAIDGDKLIDWNFVWKTANWTIKDREHLDIVRARMQSTSKCICWYVDTEVTTWEAGVATAVSDALDDGELYPDQVAIVLLSELEHRKQFENRDKVGHDLDKFFRQRQLCEKLASKYGLACFPSFKDAAEHMQKLGLNRQE